MAEIVLATLNAKYIHAAFGLRYLLANLGELRPRASLLEFDIHQPPAKIAEALLAENPKIIGLGVYIWNVTPTTELVSTLKRLCPEVIIILGGPEVSYECDRQPIIQQADYAITGEADLKFAEVCRQLLAGEKPSAKIIPAEIPDLARLASPYELYTDKDVAHRVIYVEASRGCPFTCEFCLSSLDIPVRQFPLPALLKNLEELLRRGVRQFKFVDRTFNLNIATSKALLQFFLDHQQPGLFVHFEMIPDRLPEALREVIAQFPPGALQFEVGIQTFNPEVSKLISRRQDYDRLADNFRFLREHTGVHIHADLIVGLPGESLESFGRGFDRLIGLRPQEIHVGMLKRLRGTPIVRHDAEWGMVYNEQPPYEILRTKLLDSDSLQRLRHFAKYWDLIGNSGNFVTSTPLVWCNGTLPFDESGAANGHHTPHPNPMASQARHESVSPNEPCASRNVVPVEGRGRRIGPRTVHGPDDALPLDKRNPLIPSFSPNGGEGDRTPDDGVAAFANDMCPTLDTSPFHQFLRLSDWLYEKLQRQHAIPLVELGEMLFNFLIIEKKLTVGSVAAAILSDYQAGGRNDTPLFIRPHLLESIPSRRDRSRAVVPKRQQRHLAHVQAVK